MNIILSKEAKKEPSYGNSFYVILRGDTLEIYGDVALSKVTEFVQSLTQKGLSFSKIRFLHKYCG